MSLTYFKRRQAKRFEICRRMRAAKERKRMTESVAAVEVGVVIFTGAMFAGTHRMRLLNRDGDRHLLLEFDGVPANPKTYRGVLRMLARRLDGDSK